jgi:Fe-S cluster biogenesis protein NfuA
MPANAELQHRLGSIEELLHQVESAADPSLRASVQELVELVMNLHGAGLERMLELIRATGDSGEAAVQRLGRDELVGGLLVLHGLHPQTVEARVTDALDKVRARLRPHGGEVELLTVQDGAVRLRLHAKSQGCGSTAQSLKEMVEDAVYQAAPDLTSLTIEGAEEKQSFVPLEMLLDSQPATLARNCPALTSAGKGGL